MRYEKLLSDFNTGTLLRLDATDRAGYDAQNVVVVPRIQFLAVEIARNREVTPSFVAFSSFPPPHCTGSLSVFFRPSFRA
jgi:hypothetical protein